MKARLYLIIAVFAMLVTTAKGDNVIFADALTIEPSGNADLTINLTNTDVVRGIQFTLTLPEGVTVQGSDAGIIYEDNGSQTYTPTNGVKVSLTDRTTGWMVVGNKDASAENTYKFVLISFSGDGLSAGEGAVMTISFTAAADAPLATYVDGVSITDIHMSIAGSTVDNTQADTTASLTVTDVIKGDVNNNKEVDIDDAVCILRYLVKKPNDVFIEAAANVNGNNKIDIDDAVMVLQYLVGKIPALARGSVKDADASMYDPSMYDPDLKINKIIMI